MILYSMSAEIRALKTLCNHRINENERFAMLGMLNKDFFHIEPTLAAFNRLRSIAKAKVELLGWEDLLEDPTIGEDLRDVLEESDDKACKDLKSFKKLYKNLDEFRKARALFNMAKNILEAMEEDSVDVDEVIENASEDFSKVNKNVGNEQVIYSLGKRNNMQELVKRTLYKPTESLYKTGFIEYDNTNGGLPTKGVMIMAATTSGGKSVTLMNLMKNLHVLNEIDVCRATLEMSEEQDTNRFFSMLTQIPFYKYKQKKLSDREKKTTLKKVKEFHAWSKSKDISHAFMSPTASMSLEDILAMTKPFDFKVLAIDYIGLLEGVDDENQWRILAEIVRLCKIFSAETGCLIILLAQLDDTTDKLRYSKGMKEHADIYWHWNYTDPEVRENHELPVVIGKVRDGELFTMPLKEQFDIMTVANPDNVNTSKSHRASDSGGSMDFTSDDDEDDEETPSRRKKKRKRSKDDDYVL